MGNPVDEFLELEKSANFFRSIARGVGRQFGPTAAESLGGQVAGGALLEVGAMGARGIGAAASKIHDSITKKRDFKEMMELNPNLREFNQSPMDQKRFNASYNSIRRLAPEYGRDPIVAGSIMNKMMLNPESSGTMLASMLKAPMPGGDTQRRPPMLKSLTEPDDPMRSLQMEQAQLNLQRARRGENEAQAQEQARQQQLGMFGKS